MNHLRVGLDSNCLSYLISAAMQGSADSTAIGEEGTALLRIWFYAPSRFFVTETVAKECSGIRDSQKLTAHGSFTSQTYWGVPVSRPAVVNVRTSQLCLFHAGKADCLALAEAEDSELNVLLTYDRAFLRLGQMTKTPVALRRPSEHWASLSIPKGAPLTNRPSQGNPLEGQSWWRWE
jgi:hypothetical protein